MSLREDSKIGLRALLVAGCLDVVTRTHIGWHGRFLG